MPLVDPSGVNELTGQIIQAAVEVHRRLGPGLLEAIYTECLTAELRTLGLTFEQNKRVPVVYRGARLTSSYYVDLLVNDKVVVEVKSVAKLAPIHDAQLITYLRLTGKPAGLLLNFNVPLMRDGIRRRLNTRASCRE